MFLQNVGRHSTDYMALIPEDGTLHNHCCGNLKPYEVNVLGETQGQEHSDVGNSMAGVPERWVIHFL
jgi:hypothetical protein